MKNNGLQLNEFRPPPIGMMIMYLPKETLIIDLIIDYYERDFG